MTNLHPAPLSETETRAGLWAIRRVLSLARDAASDWAAPKDLADMLSSAEALPAAMLRQAEFPHQFRDTLEGLAHRHDTFAPVLDEFDRLTGRRPTRRLRAFDPDDDPWRDCGAAD
jgi:hypothetical protein